MSHPSASDFERALRGERSPDFDAHLATCAECRARAQPRRRRWWLGALAAVLLVAALTPFLRGAAPELGPRLEVFTTGAQGPRPLAPGERLLPDSRVQLRFEAAGFARVSLFVLERGCEVAMLSGGWAATQLDGGIPDEWTQTRDGARLYAVFSAEPVTVPDFVDALRITTHGCEEASAPPIDGARFTARGVVLAPRRQRARAPTQPPRRP